MIGIVLLNDIKQGLTVGAGGKGDIFQLFIIHNTHALCMVLSYGLEKHIGYTSACGYIQTTV